MDERLRFVARLLDGERMTTLCAEFGISRKTGYKSYRRYKACGIQGLTDRSRRPQRHAKKAKTPARQRPGGATIVPVRRFRRAAVPLTVHHPYRTSPPRQPGDTGVTPRTHRRSSEWPPRLAIKASPHTGY
jgi:hypothetical protein